MPTVAEMLGNLSKETKEQKEQRFYAALGEFICTFANTETAMYVFLHHVLKVASWKMRAMIGGENMGTLISLAKRISPKCGFGNKKLKELQTLFSHLEHISKFRHDLVHRGAEISEAEIRSDNFFSAKEAELAEEMVFDIDHVTSATIDLLAIKSRLYRVVFRKKLGKLARLERKRLYAPWRYKPLARQRMWNRLLADALRRERPPAPSHP